MKKAIALLLILSILILTGCFGQFKISYDKETVYNCPKHAKAGDLVQFNTVLVNDADLYCYLDSLKLDPVTEGSYEFVMPDHDVEIRVVIVSNGLA